ncbi:multiple sugar transport system substrate-binding protein [Nonomuraea solani]|uniref:Multiple sugar transport system substrate-binding protein n=1 Tax=Nonomuraea solani TaxID=1144553 RepID=A0A1H6E2C0_9ACTN|nr:sugar ABC transporter substrate-binding protein [Nonomuraea solani]SEG91838.1 multiple sugar transport system substrate-binding protein [Nonomuraea solani]
MRTARKRPLKAVAVAALVPLSLTACGGSSSAGAGSPNTLTIQDYYEPAHDPIYHSCAKTVGVSVEINHLPGPGLIPKVLQQSSSRTLPDVLMLDNPDVQQIAASGALSPLTDYGMSGDGMVEAVVKAGTYEGKLYGLAPSVNTLVIFYNKDLFKAAGLSSPPKTWDELRAYAKKLTRQGRYGFAMSNVNTYEGSWQFLPFMWGNGGSEQDITGPETAQALRLVLDLQNDGSISKSSINWSQDDVIDQFIAGKAAMVVNGPWQIPALEKRKDVKWAAFPVPTRLATQTTVAPLGGEVYTVPRTADKAKMTKAGQFVKCLISPEMQLESAKLRQTVPSDLKVAAEFGSSNEVIAPFVTTVKTARARTAILGADWPKAATKIYTAVQAALTGKAAPEQALRQAQDQ